MKPKISVVVPAYNEEKIIKRTLESLAAQDFKLPYEVIVVDNNSNDKTADIIDSFSERHPNIRRVFEKKPGIGQARRAGHEKATGEIFVGTDADAVHPVDWLTRIQAELEKKPRAVGLVGNYVFYDKGPIINLLFHLNMIVTDTIARLILGTYAFRGNNFAVYAKTYRQSGGFNPNVSALEDLDLALRVAKYGQILYRPSLVIRMTARRFKGQLLKQTLKRLRAFYYRGIKRDTKKATDWDIIR